MQARILGGSASVAGRRLGVGLLCAAAVSTAATADAAAAGCPGSDRVPRAATVDEAATATLCVINHERARRHIPRLRSQAALDRAGRRYARDMVRRQFFSHTSPSGASMVERLRDVGYADPDRVWSVGEALAWGAGTTRATPTKIVAAWMASPPHRRLLLDRDYRDVGIGVAAGLPVPDRHYAPGATYAAELGVRG